jgi:alanine racemase
LGKPLANVKIHKNPIGSLGKRTGFILKQGKPPYSRASNSRVWLEIRLDRIIGNLQRIRKRVGQSKVMCVLKANGYGLGAIPLAQALARGGADRFGVAELKEALALRKAVRNPIQLLSGVLQWEVPEAVRQGIILPIATPEAADWIVAEARRQKRKATVHIKVDTGMGRMGLTLDQAKKWIPLWAHLPELKIEGLFSHFANANNPEHPKSHDQLRAFRETLEFLREAGIHFPLIHIANSDAINNLPEAYFDMVRTGINLYGVFELEGRQAYTLKPCLELKTTLLARRKLPAGHQVGYGCTHALSEDTWVGTVPAGYADGIPLAASNSGWVLIKGQRCPILGRVSMDYITVDLNACPRARVGDTVVLVGRSGKESITIEDWARIKQTHPYEIICSLGPRVERLYLNS